MISMRRLVPIHSTFLDLTYVPPIPNTLTTPRVIFAPFFLK